MVYKGRYIYLLFSVGNGHAAQLCLGVRAGKSDMIVVAGDAVAQCDAVYQHIRALFLMYVGRGDAACLR